MPCKFIHIPCILWRPRLERRQATRAFKPFRINVARHQRPITARGNKLFIKQCALPFDYLPSISAHSDPFLSRDPHTSRSFLAWADAHYDEILPIGFLPPSPGEPWDDFNQLKDLLRAYCQDPSPFRNPVYDAIEEQIINSTADSIEKKLVEMAVENNVYLAKLAEQAERYEGKIATLPLSMIICANTPCDRDGGVHEERSVCRPRTLG